MPGGLVSNHLVHDSAPGTMVHLEQAAGDGALLASELHRALGADWDAELELFRHAGEGAPPTWLHKVG